MFVEKVAKSLSFHSLENVVSILKLVVRHLFQQSTTLVERSGGRGHHLRK
jgi:hypothetical protein